jgi:hypothetical protein
VMSPNTDTIVLKPKIQMYQGSIRSDNWLKADEGPRRDRCSRCRAVGTIDV